MKKVTVDTYRKDKKHSMVERALSGTAPASETLLEKGSTSPLRRELHRDEGEAKPRFVVIPGPHRS
jgi:hypothetical protein